MRKPALQLLLCFCCALLLESSPHAARAQQAAVDFTALDAHLRTAADAVLLAPQENESLQAYPAKDDRARTLEFPLDPSLRQVASTILPILSQRGLPSGLTAVAVTESHGNPQALSPKGARGLWQLMPATARRYGLAVSEQRDERLDPARSTFAAASYLQDLYAQFGSWPLALAAYNWGEQNLAAALARTHATDFASLAASGALPAETRNYVPAVLARWQPEGTARTLATPSAAAVVFATLAASNASTSTFDRREGTSSPIATRNE